MKKFCVALLAAAMVAGSALCASAADVKFSGSYYAQGFVADNWTLGNSDDATTSALYGQRLRMGMEFKVAEGLTFNTRFDALEGRWGQLGTYGAPSTTGYYNRSGNDESNISFDRAWVTFAVPFGKFDVGRMNSASWGTRFGDNDWEAERIGYTWTSGPFTLGALAEKLRENYAGPGSAADDDQNNYHVYGLYKWNSGIAGLKIMYTRDGGAGTTTATWADDYTDKKWTIQPYAQATFGNFFVEAELNYVLGERDYATGESVDYDNAFNAYIHGKGTFGPAYVGALYAYVSGEDTTDTDIQAGPNGGLQWDPCLILWNQYSNKWVGNLGGAHGYSAGNSMTNAHAFQLYGGYMPMPKLDLRASVTYAMADETVANQDDEIGTEIDLTASYKIFDNLTYTVGAGYLFAGDYFKGTTSTNVTDDTYLLMHRLDLSF